MSNWIDISVPIRQGMPEWPGDQPLHIKSLADVERGDDYSLSRATMTWHVGTHMDAPGHFVRGGARIDAFPPDAGVGRARVIAIRDPKQVTARELARHAVRAGERLLFKTRNAPPPPLFLHRRAGDLRSCPPKVTASSPGLDARGAPESLSPAPHR